MRGSCQVKPNPSSFKRQKHDGRTIVLRALKLLDHMGPPLLAHGTIQAHKTETVLSGKEERVFLENHMTK